jgi:hypothetical protein
MVFKKIFFKLIFTLFCFSFFSCGDNSTVSIQDAPNPQPVVSEKTTVLPQESSVLPPVESHGGTFSEKTISTPVDLTISTGNEDGENSQTCLLDPNIFPFYRKWVIGAEASIKTVSTDCKIIEYKDSNQKTILKIKLRGNCTITVEYTANNIDRDTSINICQ